MTCRTQVVEGTHATGTQQISCEGALVREVGALAGSVARGGLIAMIVIAAFKLMAMTIGL
jgi:hypothetical protein